LGYEAIKHNYTTKIYTASQLIVKLQESKTSKSFERTLKELYGHDLLIIDDIGYIKHDENSGNFLFDVINRRYERKSTIITTNFPLHEWGSFPWDKHMLEAMIDRLSHHSIILDMTGGESWRLSHSLTERKTPVQASLKGPRKPQSQVAVAND
jgi:DNA replication protein DnaC